MLGREPAVIASTTAAIFAGVPKEDRKGTPMRSVSQASVDADDLDLQDVAPRRPTFDELVARVAAIDERVDLIDRFLFEHDDGGSDGDDDGN